MVKAMVVLSILFISITAYVVNKEKWTSVSFLTEQISFSEFLQGFNSKDVNEDL